VPVLYCATI